ncbi:MAG: MBL fold metallo-hydrolase [Candidatus Lokiarchaeota archaeon]|nr:MBL fold metallo-hydrolase [Candidatus Lokiarchaeota archaeon]
MNITFLGTNGWYATDLGNTTSTIISSDEFYIILDAGDGIYKIDQYIDTEKPIILLLSHLHLDHIIGLHTFAKLPFTQEINIYGYKGTKNGINLIIKHPYSSPLIDLPVSVQIHDLNEGKRNIGFPLTCKLLVHADPCLGYRLELENKIITYCTDTGLCPNLYELAKDADIFITECSYKPGQEEWGWPHLKPEEAAVVAVKSKVKKLVLTHFDASSYKTLQDRKIAEKKAKTIFPEAIAAIDGLEIMLD